MEDVLRPVGALISVAGVGGGEWRSFCKGVDP